MKKKKKKPLVSVCCTTYNHKDYIRDAIEGFLMQKTNFPFEIMIHDDASTDGTAEIVKKYAKKHPDLIIPILQKENQYSKKIKIGPTHIYPRARGKYIALCEGDDYWIDPLKLQKQFDFMEKNEDYVLCFHPVKIEKGSKKITDKISRPSNEISDIYDLAKTGNYINTCSVMFRAFKSSDYPVEFLKSPIGDYPLYLFLAKKGLIKKLPSTSAVYRLHKNSNWSSLDRKTKVKKKITYLKILISYFKDDKKIVKYLQNHLYSQIMQYMYFGEDFKETKRLLWESIKIHPFNFRGLILFFFSFLGSNFYQFNYDMIYRFRKIFKW